MQPLMLAAVGDLLVHRPKPEEVLSSVGPLLAAADITFGNFEGVLTDRYAATPGSSIAAITGTANAEPVRAFDVVSLANNHAMDAGYDGLNDTLETLAARDVATIGAGPTLGDALAPHIIERRGLKIAVLAVTAVLTLGTEAGEMHPGVAPLRADDYWAPAHPGFYTPGVPPRIISVLNEQDWESLEKAVAAARTQADIVIVSVHWGDHTRPWVLTDHERLCAGLLAEAKADLVLGHHQHILRGMEFLGGTPVFYGLGHLAMDMPKYDQELMLRGINIDELTPREFSDIFGEFGTFPRPESPIFPFPPISRNSAVAVTELGPEGVTRCGVVPCFIDDSGIPRATFRKDPEWDDAASFLTSCAEKAKLASRIVDGEWAFAGFDILEWTPA